MDNTREIISPPAKIGDRRLSEAENMEVTKAVGGEIGVEKPKWVPMTLDEAMGLIVDANGELRGYENDSAHLPRLVLPPTMVSEGIRDGDFVIGNESVTDPEQKFFIPYHGRYGLPPAWTVTIGATEAGKGRVNKVIDQETGAVGYGIIGTIVMQLANNPGVRMENTVAVKYLKGTDMVFMRQDEVEYFGKRTASPPAEQLLP